MPCPQPASLSGSLLDLLSLQTDTFFPTPGRVSRMSTLAKASLLLARVRDVQMMHQRPLNGPRWLRVFVLHPIDSPWSSASQNRSQVCRGGPSTVGYGRVPSGKAVRLEPRGSRASRPSNSPHPIMLSILTHTYHKEGA